VEIELADLPPPDERKDRTAARVAQTLVGQIDRAHDRRFPTLDGLPADDGHGDALPGRPAGRPQESIAGAVPGTPCVQRLDLSHVSR
jgi:hypothetical protein